MTYIGKPCYVDGTRNITIGNKTRILPGLRMEAINGGHISIGDNCVIEQNVHIISEGQELAIGNDVTISANVFVSNVNHEYRDVSKSVMDQPHIRKTTEISDGCFIGYGAAILPGTKLGKHCIVGCNSVVKGEFPDFVVVAGVPAKVIKKYDNKRGEWINGRYKNGN